VQVVAATNRDLELEVAEGRFREDLYYRLNMVEFHVPPLRQRVDDIPHFVEYFSRKFASRYERPLWRPNSDTLRQFCEYRWPGNIRQLANVIEQAYVLDCEPRVPERANPRRFTDAALPYMDLSKLRRVAVEQAMRATQGHKSRAAKLLGVHPNTMTRLLAQIRNEEPEDTAAEE
jgi:DNA-binding NtrC family response regulator